MNRVQTTLIAAMTMMVLLFTAGCGSTESKSSTGEYVDDSVITTKVKAAILESDSLAVTEINVETFKGQVQLSGFVSDDTDVDTAEEIAEGVTGVKSVTNNLKVK